MDDPNRLVMLMVLENPYVHSNVLVTFYQLGRNLVLRNSKTPISPETVKIIQCGNVKLGLIGSNATFFLNLIHKPVDTWFRIPNLIQFWIERFTIQDLSREEVTDSTFVTCRSGCISSMTDP